MKYRHFLTIVLATGLLASVSLAESGLQDYPVKSRIEHRPKSLAKAQKLPLPASRAERFSRR